MDIVYSGYPNDVTEASFALLWNEGTGKVYAAIIVNDTDPNFRDDYGTWDASDRIEIYSQGTAAGGSGWGTSGTRNYDIAQQYYVAPGETLPQWATWAHGEPLEPDVDLEYIVSLDSGDITYEIGVPMFDNYGGRSGDETLTSELTTGKVVGFDIVVCTRHSAGFGMLSENGTSGKFRNADYFAKYVLTGNPCIPGDMVWVYIDDPGVSGHEGFTGYMSKYETTNAQYCQYLNAALASDDITVSGNRVYGSNGSNGGADFVGQVYFDTSNYTSYSQITYSGGVFTVRSRDGYSMANHPVVKVSWYGATAFCNYYGYRLPTEWEWQAVADYDGSYIYGCGTTINQSKADYDYANPLGLSSWPYTSPVDYYSSYGYGMNDMAGNVWEWVSSLYDPVNGYRVYRGGSWGLGDNDCTVTYRNYDIPNHLLSSVGFRVCR